MHPRPEFLPADATLRQSALAAARVVLPRMLLTAAIALALIVGVSSRGDEPIGLVAALSGLVPVAAAWATAIGWLAVRWTSGAGK